MTEPLSKEEFERLANGERPRSIPYKRLMVIAEDHARLVAENDELKLEVAHRKAMQPTDRDDRPITQAAANRLMIIALDEYPALRAENAKLRERVETLERVATCYLEEAEYIGVSVAEREARHALRIALAATEEEPTP